MPDGLLETITAVVGTLNAIGVPYAITGSVASSVHGEPYASQDIDLILHATPGQAALIADRLPAQFYREKEVVVEAAKAHRLINVIDNRTGFKVDLSFVSNTGFFRDVFTRRVSCPLGTTGPTLDFVSAEDIIIMKLLWRKDTRSHKQWDNALSVVRVRGATLDWKYLFHQAAALDIEQDLVRLRDEGGV